MKLELFVHDFKEDLRWSELPAQYVVYMQSIVHWWPTAVGWDRITDLLQQKQGKDITIELPEGKLVKIQFKFRRADYGDFCIEYRHDLHNGGFVPGWIVKPSEANFLLYCVPGRVYRMDYPSLHEAWLKNAQDWIDYFDLPPSPNRDYDTRNVGVKFNFLEAAGVKIDSLQFNPNYLS